MPDQQVVYKLPGFHEVEMQQHVYFDEDGNELLMDMYRPAASPPGLRLPVVIFVFGYSDAIMLEKRGRKLSDSGQYVSWSRLAAASGCAAITYETNQPGQDIQKLLKYLQKNSDSLVIDASKMGIWACSSNVPTALSVLMQESKSLKCCVFYYGVMLDWQASQIVAEAAAEAGFANPCQMKTHADLPDDVPLLIVRAGQDYPPLNETIDRFVSEAIGRNLPLTFVNYAAGIHAFDVLDESLDSQRIIKQTLDYIKGHLLG